MGHQDRRSLEELASAEKVDPNTVVSIGTFGGEVTYITVARVEDNQSIVKTYDAMQ